jgi:hypothetical protein
MNKDLQAKAAIAAALKLNPNQPVALQIQYKLEAERFSSPAR